MTVPTYSTIAVTLDLSPASLDKVKAAFQTVHYYPEGDVPRDVLADVDVWFTRWLGLPQWLEFKDIPNTKVVQLTSAGANHALHVPALESDAAKKQIAVCGASGIHVLTIPQYIIGQIVALYFNFQNSHYIARSEKRWVKRPELRYRDESASGFFIGAHSLRGRTVGLLGYGHIARETARLLQAFGAVVIAANSTGERKQDDGYIIPGTGDVDGSIPEAYYSTGDEKSFGEFLSRSQILVASLPSTPATKWLLKKEHLAKLPKDALFINVGRGDLVHSEDLLASLESKDGILAAGLDVTDPEPLPDNHPLLSHPRALITPHTSSDSATYFDEATNLLLANVERLRAGGKPINRIDPVKGY
ncbi:hypothetical protein Q8F55_007827 [Vanrija albida]|uniref:D-isomer specific 2-hydroxyacid dehydrogenase NAD-binding domain-containing protein n=1 Tax=Vanrija albida TaxID=181172 RepID=A0ABR3PVM6_9TREE